MARSFLGGQGIQARPTLLHSSWRFGSRVKPPATTQAPKYRVLHHGLVAAHVAVRQLPERTEQAEQGDGHQQVDGRVTGEVGQGVVADEQGRHRGDDHQRDPGVAEGAVQARALRAGAAGPQRDGPYGQRAQGGGHVDGDHGGHLHGGLRSVLRWLALCRAGARAASGLRRNAGRAA